MKQFEVSKGMRKVITTTNDGNAPFWSRLYVNNGETATLTNATHKTLAGAQKWAGKVLGQ